MVSLLSFHDTKVMILTTFPGIQLYHYYQHIADTKPHTFEWPPKTNDFIQMMGQKVKPQIIPYCSDWELSVSSPSTSTGNTHL